MRKMGGGIPKVFPDKSGRASIQIHVQFLVSKARGTLCSKPECSKKPTGEQQTKGKTIMQISSA